MKNRRRLLLDPGHLLALGFGAGLVPVAPGTFGTLAAVPLYLLMVQYLTVPGYLLATAVLALVGIPLCGRTARALGGGDPGAVVWDEMVGLLVALAALPPQWPWILAGFALFRLFDILKPWPVSWADRRLEGGLGIMMDDLVAGLLALGLLQAARFWWGQ